jgi:HK97 family phage major capsid protein
MAAYVSRADALAFIVEQRSPEIIQAATQMSVAMQTFRTIPVGTRTLRLSLLDAFPQAQWLVAGAPPEDDVDTALKPVTEMAWTTKDIMVEEAAAIVAIPENVLDDAEVDLWGEVERRTAESVAALIDQTFFFGTAPAGPVPASFPVGGLVGEAIAKNHDYQWGTNTATEDLAEAWNQTMGLVEADGYDVNQSYASRSIRATLRGLRDDNGTPLYVTNLAGGGPTDAVYGVPVNYVTNGTWDPTKALAVMGDASLAVIVMRQQLEAKQLSEATLTGIGNLAERDMLALRVKTRLGFGVLAPKGRGQSATPYPFSVLVPKAP